MKTIRNNRVYIVILAVLLGLSALGIVTMVVNAQNQSIDLIMSNLKKRNVPAKSITLVSRVPFEIELIIQKKNNDKKMDLDDVWNAQLARREVSAAFRFGIKVQKFELRFVDEHDSTLLLEQVDLNLDGTLLNKKPNDPKLSPKQTADLVSRKLNLAGLSLDWIDVTYEPNLGDMGQNLLLELSAVDLETANQIIPGFIRGFKQLIGTENSNSGIEISLCRIRVVDKNKRVLLNFVWDVITKTETSSSAPGLAPWYPHPEPTKSTDQERVYFPTVTPNQSKNNQPTSTPLPQAYPAPVNPLTRSTESGYPPPPQK